MRRNVIVSSSILSRMSASAALWKAEYSAGTVAKHLNYYRVDESKSI